MIQSTVLNWLRLIPYFNYLQNDYILSGLIILAAIILAALVSLVYGRFLEKLVGRTKTEVDDLIVEKTKKPLFYLILAYGLKLAVLNLSVGEIVTKIVNSVMALVFVLILIRFLDIIVDAWGMTFAKKTKTKIDDVLLPLFHKVIRVIFVVIAVLWILHIWEINITPYLAGAGILGLVLGMALQDSLKNVFGGITLILDKTYQMGDKVKLESGEVGTIHDIGLRSTKLITFDNEVIYVPNGQLANSRVQNYTRPNPKVRMSVDFGVEYGSKVREVRKVVLETLKKMKKVLDHPAPAVQFLEMGDSALKFKARFWVERWDQAFDAKLEATEKIYAALNRAKINIPFPTQTVYIKK